MPLRDAVATTRDHVVPRRLLGDLAAASGPLVAPNVVPCCARCNQLKAHFRSDCTCQLCLAAWAVYGPLTRATALDAVKTCLNARYQPGLTASIAARVAAPGRP